MKIFKIDRGDNIMRYIIDILKPSVKILVNISPVFLLLLLAISIVLYFEYVRYRKSNYRNESGIKFFKFRFDRGYYGEGLTFYKLEKLIVTSK